MIQDLTSKQLEELINSDKEQDFLIVDVRQSREYRLDHIPGAVNIPLARVEFNPLKLDENRKVIFYCRSGSRSKVAALFATQAGMKKENLFHLRGGMSAYGGEILLDMPRVDLFSPVLPLKKIMEKAINFEKAAFSFYDRAKEKFKGTPIYEIMHKMCLAEKVHARTIFNMLNAQEPCHLTFDDFFEDCKGDILEGGKPLDEIMAFLDKILPENKISILEFAIELEFSAYDLYKTMAEDSKDPLAKEMFYTLAQAEKQHLSKIIHSLDLCI
jgi:rhodanese-related sulfurtransferase/rubrerythrin